MNYSACITLILLLPLACFLCLGLAGKQYFAKTAGPLGCIIMTVISALALYTAWYYFFIDGKVNGAYQTIVVIKYTWLQFSLSLSIDMGILLDPVSAMMLVVVTVISLMVHIFSLGYMKGEERISTYYAFLSLFTFSMLGLVVASNIFQTYIFWELVGLSSYLLIGFYFDKPSAVAAAKKAFIVTRFADLGFLVGILMLSFHANTLDFGTLIQRLTDIHSPQFVQISAASFLGVSAFTWALTLVFIGGAGKSAMFPLHIWLPDAMEGPTPVSALIHAATMVVAGVYLVARLFPVFSINQSALTIVGWTGAISAIIAAVIACMQTDIKRILAFSTMSQIGYMMLGMGVSKYGGENGLGYTAALFHLFTHAFFKSLLFLGAGAIIHLVHSNELKDMGGLRKLMPVTHVAFLVACLAIAGIPPLAGFFSKEEILTAAWQSNKSIYIFALFTSGLTAFYMFRLYFSVFWSREKQRPHGHVEGTISMKLPLVILSCAAALAGFVPFAHFITSDGKPLDARLSLSFSIVPVLLAAIGILLAYFLYFRQNDRPVRIAAEMGRFYRAAYNKFYIDDGYLFFTRKIMFNTIGKPAAWIDKNIIDGMMNGIAFVTDKIANGIKGIQSGKLQQYMLYFFMGILALAVCFLYLWK